MAVIAMSFDVPESPGLSVIKACVVVGEDVDEPSDGSNGPAVVTGISPTNK